MNNYMEILDLINTLNADEIRNLLCDIETILENLDSEVEDND